MANVVEAREVIGDVEGRTCVIVDDMIDTGGTIVRRRRDARPSSGATEVWAMATHGVLSGPAIDRLKNSTIERVVITNTLPLPSEKQIDKIEVLSVAKIIADAIDAVFEDTSRQRDLRRREPELTSTACAPARRAAMGPD